MLLTGWGEGRDRGRDRGRLKDGEVSAQLSSPTFFSKLKIGPARKFN
jgi:hypothetical protein